MLWVDIPQILTMSLSIQICKNSWLPKAIILDKHFKILKNRNILKSTRHPFLLIPLLVITILHWLKPFHKWEEKLMLVYPHFSSNGCCALACIHFILTYTTKPTMYCYPCLACEILYLSISILRLDGNVEQPFTSRLHLCPTNAPLCGYCKFS